MAGYLNKTRLPIDVTNKGNSRHTDEARHPYGLFPTEDFKWNFIFLDSLIQYLLVYFNTEHL